MISDVNPKHQTYLRISFLISVLALAGSLFFSEVMKLPPCVLCWYQRIFMYPLVLVFFIGLTKTGAECFRYAIGLIFIGLSIALYHNLLYYGVIPDSITPCTQGVSCTSKQLEWLGFITIPLLSFVAFSTLAILSVFGLKKNSNEGTCK
jgi:disulfide bond formation protein DsbB